MQLGSDGLAVREVGAWNDEKLFYVQRYVDIFTTGMKDKWDRLVYIDLFSGPGRSVIEGTGREVDGSPMIALKARDPFTDYFFNDSDPEAAAALRERVHRIGRHATITNLPCDEAAEVAERQFLRQPGRILALAFIDPTAFQIGFSALQHLTAGHRVDVIITLMTGYWKRFKGHTNYEEPLNNYFGSTAWRDLADNSGRATTGALLQYYEDRLRELGYIEFNHDVSVQNSKNSTIYHLVFAGKHERATDFWKKISRRRYSGQTRMDLT